MDIFKVKFLESIKRTPTVESFRFMPEKRIDFLAGQFLRVIFDRDNLENKELNKFLSFSSSPCREYIEVTKRLSDSAFSQRLKSLKKDDEILIKAPLGSCVFNKDFKNIAFLIGGIGITPVISMLEYIQDEDLDTDVILFYSNRSPLDIAFKEEIDRLAKENNRIKVFYLITDSASENKGFIFSRIDKEFLKNYLSELENRLIYIFGPPKMVEALKETALELGLTNIKTESFLGY
jgi:ferredoxin-NADP reductase